MYDSDALYFGPVEITIGELMSRNSANVAWVDGDEPMLFVYSDSSAPDFVVDPDAILLLADKIRARQAAVAAKATEDRQAQENKLRAAVDDASDNVAVAEREVYDASDCLDDAYDRLDDARREYAQARDLLDDFLAGMDVRDRVTYVDRYGVKWHLVNRDNLAEPHPFDPDGVDTVCYERV